MASTLSLNPQIVGQAENAHGPVLTRILSRTGTSKHQWVALTLTAAAGGTINDDELVTRVTDGLKIDRAAAGAAVAELVGAGLFTAQHGDAPRLALTDAGRARYGEIRAAVDEVVARAYGGIAADDLAVAARVLTLITARLNAEVASVPPGSGGRP